MAVNLIVVQGKHEGKKIPLTGPVFKIGRGETCHLRPNSERVSREHAELQVGDEGVTVRDLGSRNGTLVNGKALTAPFTLKDRDVVQVGPLTFAVSITDDAPVDVVASLAPGGKSVPIGGPTHDTDSWQFSDSDNLTGPHDSENKSGDTVLIPAFTGGNVPFPLDDDSDEGYERQTGPDGDLQEPSAPRSAPQAGKKGKPAAPASKEESAPAAEVMRKMMERLRATKK